VSFVMTDEAVSLGYIAVAPDGTLACDPRRTESERLAAL
jgi:hypothetical protein